MYEEDKRFAVIYIYITSFYHLRLYKAYELLNVLSNIDISHEKFNLQYDCISILDVKQMIKTPITIDKLISITTKKKQIFYREKLINTWLFQICD